MRREEQTGDEEEGRNGATEAEAQRNCICVAALGELGTYAVEGRLVEAVDGVEEDGHAHRHPEEAFWPGGGVQEGEADGKEEEAYLDVKGEHQTG